MAAAERSTSSMASGVTNSRFNAAQNARLPLWANSLRTEADAPYPPPSHPDHPELKSLSHTGRVRYHSRQFVPRGDPAVAKRPHINPEQEEQLLYVALYRDKVAEQQASMELQRNKEAARKLLHPKAMSANATETFELVSEREFDKASTCASIHEASATECAIGSSSSPIGATVTSPVMRDASLPPLFHAKSPAERVAKQENKKSTHIASVTSALGAGGVASEYMETKRLGKLFDEWKSRQEEKDEDGSHSVRSTGRYSDERNHSRQQGGAGHERSGSRVGRHAANLGSKDEMGGDESSPRASGKAAVKAKTLQKQRSGRPGDGNAETSPRASSSPRVAPSREPTNEGLEDDLFGTGTDYGSDVSTDAPRISESKLVGKLFQVISNPKVIGESGGDTEMGRKATYHIEGFPTLNLMRLYRGPWRLNM